MTPLRESSSMSEDPSNASSFEEDTGEGMDFSSVVSSPPRSAHARTTTTLRGNLLFGDSTSSLEDSNQEDAMQAKSPKSRRLFDDDDNNDIQYRSPRRPTLKPIDLNHELTTQATDMASLTLSSASRSRPTRCSLESIMSTGSTEEPAGLLPPVSRKRTSNEARSRRESPKTPYRNNNNNLFPNESSNSGDSNAMHMSPHISPNSFITMDGRFVQSKNPFSSPYMDEDNLTPRATQQQQQQRHFNTSGQPPPTFPLTFAAGDEQDTNAATQTGPILPRRHCLTESPLNGGFPDSRFSFTGSPISELEAKGPATLAMETDTASSGSLHKVRRLSRNDDVVAATGQHIRSLSASRPPPIDTTTATANKASMMNTTMTDGSNNYYNDDISPTDVLSFPPPPTPLKARRAPIQPPYARIPRHSPATPVRSYGGGRSEQLQRTMAARTPHPQLQRQERQHHLLHHRHHHHNMETSDDDDDDDDDHVTSTTATTSITRSKSRFYGDFDVIGELGKGSFGTVYKVLSRLDGCMYAIKAAQRQAKGRADRDRMLKEVYALAALSDQADTATFHIVRYHQAWMEDDRLYIQTELCSGNLTDEVQRCGRLTQTRRYKLLREILLALDFIHRNNMVHLDIKPDNIFLKNDQFKLGDFGLVTKASAAKDVEEGDSRYMSMELLSGDSDDLTKSDIFSLGITMYELCLGKPLPMNGQEWQNLRAGQLEPLPETAPDMAQIIAQMMHSMAPFRPSASDLLKHRELLSDEQKALIAERSKVAHANLQLAQFANHQGFPRPPPRKGLVRANTWNGSSMLM